MRWTQTYRPPRIKKRVVEARVFNLSFGAVRTDPIGFTWDSEPLSEALGQPVEFRADLVNSEEFFQAEVQLAAFHAPENRQSLGYNPRATAQTGLLQISYDDFPADLTYAYVEDANFFLGDVVAPILSFFQRRRVLLGMARFTSSQRLIYAMPPFLAGEWIDSVAFGPEAVVSNDIRDALQTALDRYAQVSGERKSRIRMLLGRYNELLNLPYVHERVEGLWRIIEALGADSTTSPAVNAEYRRLLNICNARQSANLKLLVQALMEYQVAYSDDEVRESRAFRNRATHHYLDPALLTWPTLSQSFAFLQRAVEKIVVTELGLDGHVFNEAQYSIIQNRVL